MSPTEAADIIASVASVQRASVQDILATKDPDMIGLLHSSGDMEVLSAMDMAVRVLRSLNPEESARWSTQPASTTWVSRLLRPLRPLRR